MAIVTGSQGASATPATDLYTTLTTAMGLVGWTYIEQATAAEAGTTAACEVWASASTTGPASNIYTGCLVLIEVDDTNSRLRFRCVEKYDTSAAGAPAAQVARPCPGNDSSTSQTPTVNSAYAGADTTYVTIFQAQGTSSKVGWVNIPTGGGGFAYLYGVLADDILLANNSGSDNFVIAGLTTANGAWVSPLVAGEAGVYLGGRMSTTDNNVSWTQTAASKSGNIRTSREPLNTGQALQGAFCFGADYLFPGVSQSAASNAAMGTLTTNHLYHSAIVVSPCYVHGWGSTASPGAGRSHRAALTGFIVTLGTEPQYGNTVTSDGIAYILLGVTNGNGGVYMAVDPAAY